MLCFQSKENACQDRFIVHAIKSSDESITVQKGGFKNNDMELKLGKNLRHPIIRKFNSTVNVKMPLYVQVVNQPPKLVLLSLKTTSDLICDLCEAVKIPKSEIMVSFYGRPISSSMLNRVNPYDTVLVLIKGKGGMRGNILMMISNIEG